MASDELVELEYDLERIRTARHEIADWLKSEHDPLKRADYELRLKDCQSLEQFFLARIFRYREAREIRDLEKAPTSVFQLVFEQDRKKRLEWLRTRQTALDAAILQYKSKHPHGRFYFSTRSFGQNAKQKSRFSPGLSSLTTKESTTQVSARQAYGTVIFSI